MNLLPRSAHPAKALLAASLLSATVSLTATGCGTASQATDAESKPTQSCEAPSSLVVLIAVHQGAPAASLPASAQCSVDRAIAAGAPISIVTIEGKPKVLMTSRTWELNDGQPEKDNPEAYADDLAAAGATVAKTVKGATASSNGNNLMTAMAMAADQSWSRRIGTSDATLIVADSGYTDSGAVNMTQAGMTSADPNEVATMIKGSDSCPDLAGTRVVLTGFGYATDPQPALPLSQSKNITTIWEKTLTGCGAKVTQAREARTGAGPRTEYTVKTVSPAAEPRLPARPPVGSSVVLDENALRFAPDTADLLDPKAADTALRSFATYLTSDARHRIRVTGTTANGGTHWPSLQALGQARADRIKTLLVKLGASAAQITTKGLGYTATPPVVDAATASLNRTIRIEVTR